MQSLKFQHAGILGINMHLLSQNLQLATSTEAAPYAGQYPILTKTIALYFAKPTPDGRITPENAFTFLTNMINPFLTTKTAQYVPQHGEYAIRNISLKDIINGGVLLPAGTLDRLDVFPEKAKELTELLVSTPEPFDMERFDEAQISETVRKVGTYARPVSVYRQDGILRIVLTTPTTLPEYTVLVH